MSNRFPDAIIAGDPRALAAVDRLLADMRDVDDITARELEVIGLVSRGCTDAEVGRVLWLEASTVRMHMKRLRRKLGARNRAHAVAIALREGMIR